MTVIYSGNCRPRAALLALDLSQSEVSPSQKPLRVRGLARSEARLDGRPGTLCGVRDDGHRGAGARLMRAPEGGTVEPHRVV